MSEASFVFPHQLFEDNPCLKAGSPVFIIEEFLLFRFQAFHRQKLVLLRAAMKTYADFLTKKGFTVHYIESDKLKQRGDAFRHLSAYRLQTIHVVDVVDDWLKKDLEIAARNYGWELAFHDSPQFLNSEAELRAFFNKKTRFSQAQFYAFQRKKLNILMEGDSPVSGKYSLDTENRKKLPKDIQVPHVFVPTPNAHVRYAINYVHEHFKDSVGNAEPFEYAVTFEDARRTLNDFLNNRFENFGPYEDAISTKESIIFHSVLSPLLNIGLLTPKQVLASVLAFANKHDVRLSSLEGFIRQIIGWREYVRACYLFAGGFERTHNSFKHTRPLPRGMWDGTTGIDPVDHVVRKLLKTGYCHHIERLMVLGNFLLLTETHPDEVYQWFMAYFIDSYDWVMVPNVYGMSQFADGGFMTTKPYVCGSNYILKMSDYKKGPWSEIWDGLFWRFLDKHQDLFSTNPRTSMLLKMLDKNRDSINPKIEMAEQWLKEQT